MISVKCCICFFKQTTAYELRIIDWSSDVCSSDLLILVVILCHFVEEVLGRLDRVFDLCGGLGLEPGQQETSCFKFPLFALRRPQNRQASRKSLFSPWVVGKVACGSHLFDDP